MNSILAPVLQKYTKKLPSVNSGLDLWSSPPVGEGHINKKVNAGWDMQTNISSFFLLCAETSDFSELELPGILIHWWQPIKPARPHFWDLQPVRFHRLARAESGVTARYGARLQGGGWGGFLIRVCGQWLGMQCGLPAPVPCECQSHSLEGRSWGTEGHFPAWGRVGSWPDWEKLNNFSEIFKDFIWTVVEMFWTLKTYEEMPVVDVSGDSFC